MAKKQESKQAIEVSEATLVAASEFQEVPVKMAEVNPIKPKAHCRFENFRIAKIGGIEYMFGNVHGHPFLKEGHAVQSSRILSYNLDESVGPKKCETELELIELGKPAE
jgi:hypothetical protein